MYRSATIHIKKPNRRNFRVWNSQRQRDHVTMAIPDADFWRLGSAAIPYVLRSTIGFLRASYTLLFLSAVRAFDVI